MRLFAASFAVGVVALQMQPELPAADVALAPVVATALLSLGCLRAARPVPWSWRLAQRGLVCAAACVLGFSWAAVRADWRLADALRGELESLDMVIDGRVADLPQLLDDGVRFRFEIASPPEGVPRHVLLSWYRPRGSAAPPPVVQAGEAWRFAVRLKRPHGQANPGGFDYEAWLLEQGVRATGYVRGSAERLDEVPGSAMQWVHWLRGGLRERYADVLGDRPYAGMLVALAIGEQRGIPPAQWEVFRRTGVGHLVAISGLHVTLVAAAAGAIVGWAWRRQPTMVLRWPVRKAQALAALVAAAAYALLAGLGIPVQRALIMLFVVVAALLCGRRPAPSRVLAAALLCVLTFDPWACLSAGFWLSFGAVGVILMLITGRPARGPRWRAALRVQMGISLALLPLLVLMFNAFPLLSPLANAVAIPVVSFVVAPLVLLAALLPLELPLHLAHGVTALMMVWVEWLSALDMALWRQSTPPLWLALAAVLGMAVLLLPRGTPGRPAAAVLVAALLAWQGARPEDGAFRVTVLDVGQGLAVHVQTSGHDLLFDAGPPYGANADAGSRVVLPYLEASGVIRLHSVVLSHGDQDHVGGAESVGHGIAVERWLVGGGLSEALPVTGVDGARVAACVTGAGWEWDGVRFEVLHPLRQPQQAAPREDNDGSCVLRVSNAAGSLLLTGDIGAAAERDIVARSRGGELTADVVVSSHHGSRSSSSDAFVAATLPEAVIHSAGHRNAFGHPHPEVWARWAQAGARNWRTDSQGAVQALFPPGQNSRIELSAHRMVEARYWHGR
ncbi:DNA internalization-related competence protein ComEC/Rec2 [Thauera propionica]|uniref:DNA internalization-related competence protein ComEC/Rec2 n=1 Tax=Thauera propionica TaxID=2019431 RepID=UPI0023F46671|nr:DNA internalization-related competence protein ComEC/Rec2 [Thauera propionica]MDD3675457.1 DNA internalization-related competence protein ComEC/Rec2 [Thauera propionica]